MSSHLPWTRRGFLSALGAAGVVATSPQLRAAGYTEIVDAVAGRPGADRRSLVLVGRSKTDGSGSGCIEIYDAEGSLWKAVGTPVTTESPRGLTLHPNLPVLYVAHREAIHRHLPRGSVSAFVIDPRLRTLVQISREPLALSATYPEHLSVAPDGRTLLVSATGGGAYNFFALAVHGALLPGPYALKQTGSGPHPLQASSRPHASVMHPGGSFVYSSDFGADRIHQIAVAGGVPVVASRVSFTPGSGPSYLALDPSSSRLIVSSVLKPALSAVPIDAVTGHLQQAVHMYSLNLEAAGPLAISCSGDRLYLAATGPTGQTRVSVFHLPPTSGRLRLLHQAVVSSIRHPEQLLVLEDQLLVSGVGGVARLPLDTGRGLVGESVPVLHSSDSVSLALCAL